MDKQLNDLSESINYGLGLMGKLEVREDLTIEQKIILSIYRKLIEQIEGNLILADQNLKSPSIVMVRSALETYLSLKYITQRKKFIKDRAISYYLGYLKNQKNEYYKILENPPTYVQFPNEQYREKIVKIDQLLQSPIFKKTLHQWAITKNTLNKKFKNNHEPKWYSLFKGPTSIKQLVNELNSKTIYRYYELLSLEAHGYEALNGLRNSDIINEPFSFKPIRTIENLDNFAGIARSFCTNATHEVIIYMSPESKEEYKKFLKELGLLEKYKNELNIRLNKN